MKAYLYEKSSGLYLGETEAVPGDVPGSWCYPANATLKPPPSAMPQGKAAWYRGFQWQIDDEPAPEVCRRAAYAAEADALFVEAQYYEAEAKGHRLNGNPELALAAEQAAEALLREYVARKNAIRARFPDKEID